MDEEESNGGFAFGLILALIVGGFIGAVGTTLYDEHQSTSDHGTGFTSEHVSDHSPVTIGRGQRLIAPGVSVLRGPLTVRDGFGKMPFYVEQRSDAYVLSCLVLDAKGQLVAGGGLKVPPRFMGSDLGIDLNGRKIDGGTVQCNLVKE
jgi:hypothetical protein